MNRIHGDSNHGTPTASPHHNLASRLRVPGAGPSPISVDRQSKETDMTSDSRSQAEREKRWAALSSVLAAVLLTLLKLIVGLLTGSLGILAEAAHSGLDLVAALVTYFAVRLSDQPPDERHLYGHGKVENLSALIETLLLLLTCLWIIYEAIQRLFLKDVEIEASIWAFAVMVVSIVVDISRSRVLYRAARKHKSQALEADALHFSTDIWSSSVVIVGLALVWLSQRLGSQWAWLVNADAVAALAVALIVIYVSFQLGRRAVAVLLDAAPPGLIDRIATEASQVPGVQTIGPVRVRQAGASTFADLTVAVDRSASLEEAHQIASAVETRISALMHRGDVVVHVDPVQRQGESLPQAVSAIAARLGVRAHNIHAHEVRGEFFVDLHAEVPPDLTVSEAHEQISRLETAVRHELPFISDINTHIEPRVVPVTSARIEPEAEASLQERIRTLMERVSGLSACHGIRIRPGPAGYDVVIHCLADPDMLVVEAHQLAERAEKQLRARVPEIGQVLIHVEPDDKRG
jgi:cation diffusion facilitator family transporter